jgi:hypothetical protein
VNESEPVNLTDAAAAVRIRRTLPYNAGERSDEVRRYILKRATTEVPGGCEWESPAWRDAGTLRVNHFHQKSSSHRPKVEARAIYDEKRIHVLFGVEDRYVRSLCTKYQGSVCRDSCVEFFVQPVAGKGYFNYEVNAGGTLHLSYVEDHRRTSRGFGKCTLLPPELGKLVDIRTTLPPRVDPEITEPLTWLARISIPFAVMEPYVGTLQPAKGDVWRANFYKCADETSHPHWASWAPIDEQLNFHLPGRFAPIEFG